MSVPAVFAHRGAGAAAPQNSLAAFTAAIELGADGIELDVRATADGELVVFHDASCDGTPVVALRYGELRRRAAAPVARLADVVCLVAGRTALDVELKAPGYVEAALGTLSPVAPAQLIVTSFDAGVLAEVRASGPLRCGLIVGAEAQDPGQAARELERCGAELVVLEHTLVARGWLDHGPLSGHPALAWTVNRAGDLRRCLSHPELQAVITDEPARALAWRRALASRRALGSRPARGSASGVG